MIFEQSRKEAAQFLMLKFCAFVVLFSMIVGSLCFAEKTPLSITVYESEEADFSTYGAHHKDYTVGDNISFLGKYSPEDNTLVIMEPAWIFITYPERPYWRITFETPNKNIISGTHVHSAYLKPKTINYLKGNKNIGGLINTGVKKGNYVLDDSLSLDDIYGNNIPLIYRTFDKDRKMVRLEVVAEDREFGKTQVFAFHIDKPILGMGKQMHEHREYAFVSGSIEINRPELPQFEKGINKIPSFSIKVNRLEPIHVEKSPHLLFYKFFEAIKQSEPRLKEVVEKYGFAYFFEEDQNSVKTGWYKGQIMLSAPITKIPFSFKPVPIAHVIVMFDPENGQPQEIIFHKSWHADPWD